MKFKIAKRVFAAAMLFGYLQVNAGLISDPSGDYVNGYNGSKIGDLVV